MDRSRVSRSEAAFMMGCPPHGSLGFTAQTQEQRALICDITHLLESGASLREVVDTLNQLLRTL